MARRWKIRAYVQDGKDVFRESYDGLPPQARAKLHTTLRHLLERERKDWKRPRYSTLQGGAHGLGEIRIEMLGVQYRPIGFFDIKASEYTVVVGATKKGKRWDPSNAEELGQQRKAEILANRRCACDCDWI